MATQDAAAVAQSWVTRLGQSGDKIKAGVQAVQVAPGVSAARQVDAYVNNVIASKQKWASRVSAVTLSEWQQAMTEKGVSRITQGAQSAQPKMVAFFGKLLPYINANLGSLPPRGDLEQNINRMTTWTRKMAQFSA